MEKLHIMDREQMKKDADQYLGIYQTGFVAGLEWALKYGGIGPNLIKDKIKELENDIRNN